MSKFFYSGSMEQVNYLSRLDVLLEALYGKWQAMLIEGILFITVAIGLLLLIFFPQGLRFNTALSAYVLNDPIAFIFLVLFWSMAIVFTVVYFIVRKKITTSILKFRLFLDLIAGLFLFFLPGFTLGLLGFLGVIIGMSMILNYRRMGQAYTNRILKNIIAWLVLASGLVLIFRQVIPISYLESIIALLLAGTGAYLIKASLRFGRSITLYEDEQKGFTDYTIE